MPNYFAHLQFGAQVLAQLPQAIQELLKPELEAYRIGQYGPDPLFFYHPLTNNFARRTGLEMHHQSVRPVLERLRSAVEKKQPFAAGYAAGFLCHFALDSQCHAYIQTATQSRQVTHAGIESEFDRLLMLRAGLNPCKDTPLPAMEMPDEFYETVVTYAYPGVTPVQFQKGFRLFRRVSRAYTRMAGSPLRHLINWTAGAVRPWSFFRHAVLPRKTAPAYQTCVARMAELFQSAVAPTAAQLTAFFEGIARREPLGAWYDRDFSGHSIPPPCLVGRAS